MHQAGHLSDPAGHQDSQASLHVGCDGLGLCPLIAGGKNIHQACDMHEQCPITPPHHTLCNFTFSYRLGFPISC